MSADSGPCQRFAIGGSVLLEHWQPVTYDMGLINTPIEQAVAELTAWHASIGTTYLRKSIASSLADAFEALPPLSQAKSRRLFITTTAGWTACFQSGIQGSDPTPAMSTLAERLGVLAMRVCATPQSAKWPATIWEVFAPTQLGGTAPLGHLRTISASNDGGSWVFSETGARFPFEKPEFYDLPIKRDRFPRTLLEEYLQHFDLAPFSDDFYQVSSERPAVVLDCCRKWASPPPEFTLEEVVAGLPWQRK